MAKFVLIAGTVGVYKFWCDGCQTEHQVWTDKKDGVEPWQWDMDVDYPTVSPSILVNAGRSNPTQPVCHSFIRDGKIQYLGDCSHNMKNQTVELKDIE